MSWLLLYALEVLIALFLFAAAIGLFFVFNHHANKKRDDENKAHKKSAHSDYFLQTKQQALQDEPNPEALWQYSVLLDKLSIEKYPEVFDSDISSTQAKRQAQMFYEKALQANSAAARVQSADTLIKSAIKNGEIIDITAFEHGLDILISVLKHQCRTEFINSDRYPYYDNDNRQFKWNYGLITQHKHSLLSHYQINSSEMPRYPSLHNRLDSIDIRNKIHCLNKQNSIYTIIRFLAGNQYTDDKVRWHTPLRHLICLSVLAELLDKPNAVYLIAQQVVSTDKTLFDERRQTLLLAYQQAFGEAIPNDNWQPTK